MEGVRPHCMQVQPGIEYCLCERVTNRLRLRIGYGFMTYNQIDELHSLELALLVFAASQNGDCATKIAFDVSKSWIKCITCDQNQSNTADKGEEGGRLKC